MAKENKFGTFGGVYTPSLLTILGVIMYLRLPWVVGHAGLWGVLGIIIVAHVISIATGLSISSIATDKNVGAGGPYYIVSRSMGLPIGGALGLALFIGLCFSTSLYVIGLSESVLATFGVEPTPTMIRLTGSISLVIITAVTIISTSFAIKTQYVVLALIALSLLAIFAPGVDGAMETPPLEGEPPSMALLFGIFFPAVTGFTAGVNMSGDLKDPKRAIPRGTMAAIFTGLAVYLGLAVFLHLRVPKEALIGDTNLLPHFARKLTGEESSILVVGGIWGATFSSGLGSIMGAPRILQALSTDRITPAIFAKGKGPAQEPRNALILAFILAEAGILIAELNAIARIVSMVFLTMYAFLNISCALEAKVSPDFRPAFRIPATVSVVGAIVCFVIMIQLDLAAMLGASLLMVGLFVLLQRRQLELDSGDAWQGVWSSMIRSGLYRITTSSTQQQRNWRPNIVGFRTRNEEDETYDEFAHALITGNGILTDFELRRERPKPGVRPSTPEQLAPHSVATTAETSFRPDEEANKKKKPKEKEKKKEKESSPSSEETAIGMFRRRLSFLGSPFNEIQTVCKHYGFSGLEPNSLLMPWALHEEDPMAFADTLDVAADQDFNVLVYKHDASPKKAARIDIWWRVEQGNVAFGLALLRFITRAPRWEAARLRFILVSSDSANNDNLRSTMRRLLREGRVDAQVKIENDTFADRSFADRVRNLSEDAALTVLGLPNESGILDEAGIEEMQAITKHLGRVLFVRGSSSFPEVLPTGRAANVSELPPGGEGESDKLPELELIACADIATYVTEYSEAYQRLVGRLSDQCLKKVYGRHIELIREIRQGVVRHLSPDKSFRTANPRRKRTAFNRQQSSFLLECRNLLEKFEREELSDLRSILEGGIDAFLHDDAVVVQEKSSLLVSRSLEDMEPREGDSAYVRRFKRRRRIGAWLKRRAPQYRVPTSQLQQYYFEYAIKEMLTPALRGLVTETHQMLVQLGKVLNSTRAEMPDQERSVELEDILELQRKGLLEHLDDLDVRGKELIRRRRWSLIVEALHVTQRFADDISRFDFLPHTKKHRTLAPERDVEDLVDLPGSWKRHQAQLSVRAALALSLSGVQHRLTAIVTREREAVDIGLKNGAHSECNRVMRELEKLRADLYEVGALSKNLNLYVDPKTQFESATIVENLVQECRGSTDELPATLATLSDDSIQALEEGRIDAVEQVELPVRRLMQFLIDTELIGGLQEAFRPIPKREGRSLGVAQDVVRLVNFQISELETIEDPDPEEVRSQMLPVVENGIERLKGELTVLGALRSTVLGVMDEKLHLVVDGTNAYELSSSTGKLDQHIRVHQGKLAVSGARGLLVKGVSRARAGVVGLIYGRSEGLLLARKRQTGLKSSEQVIDRVSKMVRTLTPRPEILSALPFYYRQLFFGQSGINETFWVGRKEQIAEAKRALRVSDSGVSGCLLVVGNRLAGKSALIQKLSSDVFERRQLVRVHAPPGGSIEPRVLLRALAKGLGPDHDAAASSDIFALFASIPRGSIILMDDLNLWWERSEAGLTLIDQILRAVDKNAGRLLFVFGLETQAFRLMNRLVPLSEHSLSTLHCGPVAAESLQSIVTLRHASTGLKYRFGKKTEDEMSAIGMARVFSQHFDHSGGSIGATLRAWIASVQKARQEVLDIELPTRKDWEALDSLRPNWVALLVQLYIHKQMSTKRLRRTVTVSDTDFRRDLEPLLRMGLIVESQRRVLEIEPSVTVALQERFTKQGWLS